MNDTKLFSEDEITSDVIEALDNKQKGKLSDKFGAPPFSIFDARQGYWRKRKKEWKSLGMIGELGRDANTYNFHDHEYFKRPDSHDKTKGVSIFDPVLTELHYRWFVPNNKGKILDPFAGGSVRGIIASVLGYNYVGIELREEQVKANRAQAKNILDDNYPTWYVGNAENMNKFLNDKFDYIFTCPPYYDLEVYSDEQGELSAYDSYDDFIEHYYNIIKQLYNWLKPNRFITFTVGSVRGDNDFYYGLVADTIKGFEKAGFGFYNDGILITDYGSLVIRVSKQFNNSRKLGKTHQNVLTFYKGDSDKIANQFDEININEIPK